MFGHGRILKSKEKRVSSSTQTGAHVNLLLTSLAVFKNQSRADFALVMVSRVVNVYDRSVHKSTVKLHILS